MEDKKFTAKRWSQDFGVKVISKNNEITKEELERATLINKEAKKSIKKLRKSREDANK